MGVYRSDQAQLTFAAEAAQGGDPEMMEGNPVSSSPANGLLDHASGLPAGSRSITVNGISNTFVVGDFIRIGTVQSSYASTVVEHEVRRIESMASAGGSSTNTFTLDRPTAFFHDDDEVVYEVDGLGDEGDVTRHGDNNKFLTFIPGVYETIETPDPSMSIEGRRFLSTTSKRNVSVFYPGQQTLTGGVSGIVLLNGWPLRFPIGQVASNPSSTSGSATITINNASTAAARKGDVYMTVSSSHGLQDGDHIAIYDDASLTATKVEVRRVVDIVSTNTLKLNYPLQFEHPHGAGVREVASGAYYTHTINETVDLDTVSWHVHMKDSTETATKNFDRRYVGGMIGSSTISAEEGGMLTMSWDSVNFLNMVHNQANQKTVGDASGDDYYGASVSANMPRYGLMQAIDSDDVGQPSHNGAAVNDGTGYPTTSPYYFSEGTIKFFGQEFARIRSFSISISNGEEPRYYIGKQGARARGPFEIREGAREYSMSASVVLPDADNTAAASVTNAAQDSALELFKQLLLEGDYGAGGGSVYRRGFTATLKFERGTNDSITIDIPPELDGTVGSPTEGTDNTNQLNKQGIFINSAPHTVTTDNPFQVDLDMVFRSLRITIVDSIPVYP